MRRSHLFALLTAVLVLCLSAFSQGEVGRLFDSHLGVKLENVSPDRASASKLDEPKGLEVVNVEAGSPSEAAGIKPGDVLLTYNSEEILSVPQIARLVAETPPGRRVRIQYWRDGKMKSTAAVLAPAQARRTEPQQPPGSDPWSSPIVPNMLMLWDDPVLGVEYEPLSPQLGQFFGVQSGVLVRAVIQNTVAEKAGVKAGDIITSINTRVVAAPRDLIAYRRLQREPGRILSFQIVRDRKPRTLTLSLNQ